MAAADGKVLAVQTKQARPKAPRLDVLRRGAFCFPAANFSLVRYAFIQVQSAPASHPEKLLVLERLKKLPIALTPNSVIHLSTRKTSGESELGAALQCGSRIETAREPSHTRS